MTNRSTHTAVAGAQRPGRPAAHRQQTVTGALYVDLGDNSRPPRARYECVLCRTTEGPVTGVNDVTAFTATVRAVHRARCAVLQEHRS